MLALARLPLANTLCVAFMPILVRTGPFRFLRHPNYTVVTAEIAVLPLVFGLGWIALLFTLLNAAMLHVRIGAENGALYAAPGGLNAE